MRPPLKTKRLALPAASQASAIPCRRRLQPELPPFLLQPRLRLTALHARQSAWRRYVTTHERPSDGTASEPSLQKQQPGRRPGVWTVAAVAVVAGAAYWATCSASTGGQPVADDGSSSHRAGSSLNQETFVPFQVVARETVSPTAFVLTLRLPRSATPESRAATRRLIDRAWQHGLWSIEVKQPQLQIARDYTPLPAVGGAQSIQNGNGGDDVEMRIFVRTVPGGEVSRYLSQRVVGSAIDVRGPRLGFDVASRLSARGGRDASDASDACDASDASDANPADQKKVVVLAGGTGIATALQAAAAVLDAAPVTILWANRLGQDSVGLAGGGDVSLANPIVRDLRALQARYGADRLRVLSYVDAEQTFIKERDVQGAVGGKRAERGWGFSWWPFGRSGTSGTSGTSATAAPPALTPSASAAASAQTCVYHSKPLLERLESDPEYGSARAYCLCSKSVSGRSPPSSPPPGSSLVLVSGPDGFISAWAGPKTWAAGLERQGPVGGILGAMAAKDATLAEWQVLKL